MKQLKSLNEFKQEVDCLNTEMLKQINGGYNYYYTQSTCKYGCDDESQMCQEYRMNPYTGRYAPYGIAYQISFCYADSACAYTQ
jgi:hypothetical protein